MNSLHSQSPFYLNLSRLVYRFARGLYRQLRGIRNRLFNLIDSPIVILVYHRVAELPSDPEMIAVSPANFRLQMEYLKQHFRILRFEEEWPKLTEPAVVITFDDGYADNVLEALPILEEVGVPATFFVSTGNLGSDEEFWWHQLEAVLLRDMEFPDLFELKDSRFGRVWESATLPQRSELYATLSLLFRKLSPESQEHWLDQLREWAPPCLEVEGEHRVMSEAELKQLAASPWATIGAHTVNHAALSSLSEEQQRHEIFLSKQTLERITAKRIMTFSYPFGRKSEYNRTSVQLCREAGFSRVAANFTGQAHKWTDPLQIPRCLVRNWDLKTFASEMKRFWTR